MLLVLCFLDAILKHPSVNIHIIYLGHANGYTNGRMRYPRRERRERQGDVSSLASCNSAGVVMQTLTTRGKPRATVFHPRGGKRFFFLNILDSAVDDNCLCREVLLFLCKSCPSSSWLLCQRSVKLWSTVHRTASASGRKSPSTPH